MNKKQTNIKLVTQMFVHIMQPQTGFKIQDSCLRRKRPQNEKIISSSKKSSTILVSKKPLTLTQIKNTIGVINASFFYCKFYTDN